LSINAIDAINAILFTNNQEYEDPREQYIQKSLRAPWNRIFKSIIALWNTVFESMRAL
jgi:hypothetical protein